ncbi:hypothetical protein DPMN_105849 [Dreissena polymorpha]|uniref:Uncharacterized protein n=1 Tax=Dreissena polymorpha TaxID=45954 RepID=A0A9D4QHU5_DREPO|nr:hypothetical protein DPMN_105849 [Dreissena polymorpha]
MSGFWQNTIDYEGMSTAGPDNWGILGKTPLTTKGCQQLALIMRGFWHNTIDYEEMSTAGLIMRGFLHAACHCEVRSTAGPDTEGISAERD